MIKSKRFWFLRNWQAWTVLALALVTAIFARQPWIVALGIIGYLLILLFEAGLDPSSLVRMLHAEQENRALRAEHSRLVGGIKDLETRNKAVEAEIQQLRRELEAARLELEKTRGQPGSPGPESKA